MFCALAFFAGRPQVMSDFWSRLGLINIQAWPSNFCRDCYSVSQLLDLQGIFTAAIQWGIGNNRNMVTIVSSTLSMVLQRKNHRRCKLSTFLRTLNSDWKGSFTTVITTVIIFNITFSVVLTPIIVLLRNFKMTNLSCQFKKITRVPFVSFIFLI